MDKKTEKRIKKMISETRYYMQEQAEIGTDILELAQVMLTISREAMVDAYGEYFADSYIKNEISRLKRNQNSITD